MTISTSSVRKGKPMSIRLCCFNLLLTVFVAASCFAALAASAEDEYQIPELMEYESLEQSFNEALESDDNLRAIKIAEQMSEVVWPRYIETIYNIARLYSLEGDRVKAYEHLYVAIDAGFWDAMRMYRDEAFESIREEKLFRTLVRSCRANGYIWMLERDERAEFQKPDDVMTALSLKPGDRVADIGAGSGYFTIPVAKQVGQSGKVWAIDAWQDMLDYLGRRIEIEQLENVQLQKVERDDPELPPEGVDVILMIDTLHYIKDRAAYAAKLREGLAPGGRVIIIDYKPKPFEERPWGPPPEQQMSKEEVDEDFAAAGLRPVKVHDFLPEQYFVEYATE
jgi:SAM-dependent methyltransferase